MSLEPGKTRKKHLYDPSSETPFRISRSKIDLFMECPRCFYLDRKLGVVRPKGFPFTLNSAVDTLLKKEFDTYRQNGTPHPLMQKAGLDAIPFKHEKMDEWRDALQRGITYPFPETNLLITGAVDDIWMTSDYTLIIVDYKATSKKDQVSIDADWQISYKRQMEIYQWLFTKNNFKVYPIGYFVYCNGDSAKPDFDNCLHFDISLIPYQGDTTWIESKIKALYDCLQQNQLPNAGLDCKFCTYRTSAGEYEK